MGNTLIRNTKFINYATTVALVLCGCSSDDSDATEAGTDVRPRTEVTDSGPSASNDRGSSGPMDGTASMAEDSGSPEPADAGGPDPTDPDAMPIPEHNGPRKKGIAMHQGTFDWSEKVAAVKPFWSYSWGLTLSQFQPNGVEFVPMKWSGALSDEDADYLRQKHAAGDIKYLLGYNEPDGERQANMSVDRALELWPQLEATGIPLVSPSPVHYDNEWMIEFMQRADEAGARIDDIAFHWYGGTDAQWFLDLLDRVYERLIGKPPAERTIECVQRLCWNLCARCSQNWIVGTTSCAMRGFMTIRATNCGHQPSSTMRVC